MNSPITQTASWTLQYQLTMATNLGTTSPAVGTHWYNAGTVVPISATAPVANPGEQYLFNGWTGTGTISYTGTNNPAQVTMNSPITQTASWILRFSITATAYGPGSVTPAGVTWVTLNGSQGYSITPNLGANIDSVLIDGVNQGVQTVWNFTNVTSSHTITGYFSWDSLSITATAYGPGSVTPAGVTWLSYGSNQSYAITPNVGAHIDSVVVDGVNVGVQTNWDFINVTVNHTIVGYFSLDTFSITATAYGPGSVTPAGVTWVSYGGSQGYTITPNIGASIDSVLIDGVNQGVQTVWNFTNVQANHTIAGFFSLDSFTITSSTGPNGTISPLGITRVIAGGSQAYIMTPDPGYAVLDVLVDGSSVGPASNYTFTNVQANHTIHVTYALIYRDVGIVSIPAPGASVPVCTPFNPTVEVYNYTFPVAVEHCTVDIYIWRYPIQIDSLCHISANLTDSILVYSGSVAVDVNSGSNNVQFPSWHPIWTDLTWLGSPTYHFIHSSVRMTADQNPDNNDYYKQFNVGGINNDLQVNGAALLLGSTVVNDDTIRTGTSYNTMSAVSNNAPSGRLTFRSRFKITRVKTGQTVYSRYLDRTLNPMTYSCLSYSSGWVPQDTGWYKITTWIETRPGVDVTPDNNSFERYYYATYLTSGPSDNIQGEATLTETYALFANHPNPFANMTQIRWQIPVASRVMISIYDATGRVVKTLVNGEHNAGIYSSGWNRTDERGQKVAAGIYFYEMKTENFTQRRKMILTQ